MSKSEVLAQPTYTQIKACRACGSPHWEMVINLGTHYVCAFVDRKDDNLPQAPLELVRCDNCGLVQLKHSVNPDLLWRDYHYRSSINQTMRDALQDVVNVGLKWKGDGSWLDIGANDGCLLSKVPETFVRIACEPARTFTAALEEHADTVIADYFKGQDDLVGRCDVITSCAMFYDLDEPLLFCKQINRCLGEGGIWINQLTSTDAMLLTNGFDNIVHEHRLYPDLAVIQRMYTEAGLAIIDYSVNDVNGGSIRLVAMRKSEAKKEIPPVPGIPKHEMFAFGERIKRWKTRFLELLDSPSLRSGTTFGVGASTKASTFLQYTGISDRLLAIADRNPLKDGKMMAGIWVPIVDETRMRRHRPEHALLLAWPFRKEILAREKAMIDGGTVMVVPLPDLEIIIK
jgi:C-methyltransferase C-terminal domain/Putative zinc binding domain